MKSIARFPNTSSNGHSLGRSLLDSVHIFFEKLSLKRPSDFFYTDGQKVEDAAPKTDTMKDIYRRILDFSDDFVYIKDKNLKYIDFNKKFKELFNIKDNYYKFNDFEIMEKEFAYILKKHEREVLLTLTPSIFDYEYQDRFFHIKIFPIKIEKEIVAVGGILEDRTYFKRKIENLLELNEFLKNRCTIFEKLSMIDPLTEVYNKQKFQKILEKEVERADRYDEPLSLIIFDIDNFKKINDTYGHLIGDNILKKVIKNIKENIRKVDFISRIGGDEFTIIAPNTDLLHAYNLAQKLKKELDNLDIKEIDEKITCSFGIAQYKNGENVNDFFKRADSALYMSKKEGKNRISLIK